MVRRTPILGDLFRQCVGLIFGNTRRRHGGRLAHGLYFNITEKTSQLMIYQHLPCSGPMGYGQDGHGRGRGDPREGGFFVFLAHGPPECGDGPSKKGARRTRSGVIAPPTTLIEVMACPGGCLARWRPALRNFRRTPPPGDATACSTATVSPWMLRFSHENPGIQKLYTEFLGVSHCMAKPHDTLESYAYRSLPAYQPKGECQRQLL